MRSNQTSYQFVYAFLIVEEYLQLIFIDSNEDSKDETIKAIDEGEKYVEENERDEELEENKMEDNE